MPLLLCVYTIYFLTTHGQSKTRNFAIFGFLLVKSSNGVVYLLFLRNIRTGMLENMRGA